MDNDHIITVLKALADPTRLEIVRQLSRGQDCTSCTEVRSATSLSQPTISHHCAKLVEANIILEHKEGKEKVYELNKELLQAYGLDPSRL